MKLNFRNVFSFLAGFSLMVVLGFASGCTALGKLQTAITPASAIVVQAAVDVAVSQAIGNDPLTQKVKALAIKTIATQIAAEAGNPTVTLAALESTLNAQVAKLAVNPGELAAFMLLTQSLQALVNQKITTSGTVTQSTQVAVVGLANAVIQATSFYGV